MNTGYTAGPWIASNAHTGPTCWRVEYDGEYRNDGYVITSDLLGTDAEANARLIAAAPELYERLVMAVARIEDMLREDDGQAFKEARKALPAFRAALAKATTE